MNKINKPHKSVHSYFVSDPVLKLILWKVVRGQGQVQFASSEGTSLPVSAQCKNLNKELNEQRLYLSMHEEDKVS